MTQAHPLQWPDGWPRTDSYKREDGSRFNKLDFRSGYRKSITLAQATESLLDELVKLHARHVVISSNVQLRQDGLPRSGQRIPDDPGVAVYFELDGVQKVMARDAFAKPEHNIRSLALAIEGMRQLERHGGGIMAERAFSGFDALPAPDGSQQPAERPWWDVLGVSEFSRPEVVTRAYRQAAKRTHPDSGGTADAFAEIKRAYDQAKAARS